MKIDLKQLRYEVTMALHTLSRWPDNTNPLSQADKRFDIDRELAKSYRPFYIIAIDDKPLNRFE